ncbi:MAG: hypothetical protein ABI300_06430 [Rhodanobacter sp.]
MKTFLSTLALTALLPLAACGQSASDGTQLGTGNATQMTPDASQPTGISGQIHKAMQKAKHELATENIDVNSIHINSGQHHEKDSRPKAEITPQGELLIAGKKVNATPAQQTLLLDYRKQIVGVAESGMDIGSQGAELGISAAKQALWGKLSGKSDDAIETAIKPQTEKIRAAALQLCQRLPDLLTAQQKLGAAMPEFQPYATMQQKDVDDCGKHKDGTRGFAVFTD